MILIECLAKTEPPSSSLVNGLSRGASVTKSLSLPRFVYSFLHHVDLVFTDTHLL
jgi:hypothetical protein